MNFGISFAPLVPETIVWVALAIACVLAAMLVFAKARGKWMRIAAMTLFVLALGNPSITREDRDPLTSVAVVVIDKSPSQEFGDRPRQTEAVRAEIAERLGKVPGIEVRFVEAGQADGETDGTRLFNALTTALSDVPHDRVAGALIVTDGRVHDVPTDAASLGFAAPVHALITGRANERDRRVVLVTTPRFGIVGQSQTISYRVEDQGASTGTAQITVRRDGETIDTRSVRVGCGMISRGEVGLIVTAMGASTGIFGRSDVAVMVAVVLLTTLVTPLLLRGAFQLKDEDDFEDANTKLQQSLDVTSTRDVPRPVVEPDEAADELAEDGSYRIGLQHTRNLAAFSETEPISE